MSPTGELSEQSPEYRSATDYLFRRVNFERLSAQAMAEAGFKLHRMRRLLDVLGSPEQSIPVVHVAGTKGKGSTSVMTAAMLQAAGYRVGLYTSPHRVRFEERMVVNGVLPTPQEIVDLVRRVQAAEAELGNEGLELTFFEQTTAMSWLHFQASRVDIAVFEVGLGGRLDSTNVCRPLTTVITSISRDHMRMLGDTLESIAREKAGIAKRGVPMLSGVTAAEPAAAIRKACHDEGAPLYELDREIRITNIRPLEAAGGEEGDERPLPRYRFDLATPWTEQRDLAAPLAGFHQVTNTALAVTAVRSLEASGFVVSDGAIREGLSRVDLPLRLEVLSRRPLVIVDSAHNDASIQALRETLQDLPCRKRTLIFGSSRDKETARLLEIAIPAFDRVIVTPYLLNPRAVSTEELLEIARSISGGTVEGASSPAEAWALAQQGACPDDLICVSGSFFLAAEFRELLTSASTPSPPTPS